MMRRFTAETLSAAEAYALLVGIVVPRPIAWITTMDAAGAVNAAPFSCYTFVCNRPPMLAVNIGRRDGALKDTAANIESSGEFVVNVVTEAALTPMHASSAAYPPGVSEVAALGLEVLPSARVAPPRLACSPIAMECRLERMLELGEQKSGLLIGEVLEFQVEEALLEQGRRIAVDRFLPVARLGGPHYATLGHILTQPKVGEAGPTEQR
ncbi:flavin reductase family protein [Siccirubricoccus phaeus]|uniref:flavin reductase family protein n=1 Tax=Siccirubricoccus phaeus TaxID=2595053 RepID=UPI001A9C8060|nr:flavin reductase family protein [Siccirubricoccus phaeus]